MRNRTLIVVLAALTCAVLSASVFAAEAAKTDKKFNQDEVLTKMWAAPDDTVVGTVDGVKVTKRELLKTLWFWQGPSVLQDLMNQKMIEQAAKKAGVEIPAKELYAKAGENITRMGMTDMDQFLAQFRVTKQRFLSGTKLNMLAEKTVEKQIKVPDSEYADWIKARHILIRFPAEEQDQAKKEEIAKAKIDEVAAKVNAGEDFAKLADEYSQDPGNEADGQKKGGDLGWFTRGRQIPEFEKVAFELTPGQVSEPVKTFYGYHLIKLDKAGKGASPAEKAELQKMILEKKIPQEIGKWFSEMQAKSKSDNKLMGPQPATPPGQPGMRPPAGRPGPAPAPRPSPAPRPAPAPAPAQSEPPASAKPDAPPPPPPPPAPAPAPAPGG